MSNCLNYEVTSVYYSNCFKMYHVSVFILGNRHTWMNGCPTGCTMVFKNEINVHLNLLQANRSRYISELSKKQSTMGFEYT